jgi:hypothetical protein
MKRLVLSRSLLLSLVVSLAACVQPRTQIWLEVETDLVVPGEIDRVSITVSRSGRGAWPFTTTAKLGEGGEELPLSLGLIPEDERDLSLDVHVAGLAGTKPVVARAIQTSFVKGETRVLTVVLAGACRGVACGADQSCAPPGLCVPEAVDPRGLPRHGEDVPLEPTVVLAAGADTPLNGAPSELAPHPYPCPAGDVVTGFDVELKQGLVGGLQMICATPAISSAAPLAVRLSVGRPAAAGAVLGDAPLASRCPPDQVIVGFDGRSGLLLDQLSFRCAPLVLLEGGATVGLGDVTNLTPVGGGGGSPMPRTDCEPGMMARGVIVSQGSWLERMGLACARMELR